MKTFKELREELASIIEDAEMQERISGKGTDRKAVLKRAFRAGQHKTDNFYGDRGRSSSNTIAAPKGMRKDKGIAKAFDKGRGSDDGALNPPKGRDKMKSQDSLQRGRSKMRDGGKYVGPTSRLGLVHPNDRKKLPK